MTLAPSAPAPLASPSRVDLALWTALAVLTQLTLGVGVVVGLVLALTAFREERPALRWAVAGAAGVVLVLQVIGLTAGGASLAG